MRSRLPRASQNRMVYRESQPAVRAPWWCPGAGRDERRAIRAEVRPGSPLGWPGRSSARREEASRAGWASFSCTLQRRLVEFSRASEALIGVEQDMSGPTEEERLRKCSPEMRQWYRDLEA